MRREILDCFPHNWNISGCCPGHDIYPNETYKNNRSKRARSRDKKIEHKHARSVLNNQLKAEVRSGLYETK